MPIARRVVLLLVALALSLLAVAAAQPASAAAAQRTVPAPPAQGSTRPPVDLGGGHDRGSRSSRPARPAEQSGLPDTGSDPRLLFLTGVALTLLGAGLRLRTADADAY